METLIVDLKNIGKAAELLLHTISKMLKDTQKSTENTKSVVVHLIGEMGAGKTTFTKAVSELLGVKSVVHSPTFIIMNEYDILAKEYSDKHKKLIHIDAYRFEKKDESNVLEIEKYLNENNIIMIEWPTLMHAPAADVTVNILHTDDENVREFKISTSVKDSLRQAKP
jgi:tRNA threonylcarbamoyladenosine biosynthesis protein TsaE